MYYMEEENLEKKKRRKKRVVSNLFNNGMDAVFSEYPCFEIFFYLPNISFYLLDVY